jgi:hypothetical protein
MIRNLLVLAGLCAVAGCRFGHSVSPQSTAGDAEVWTHTVNRPGGVDQRTEQVLLSEWRAARFSCTGEPAGCPYQPGAFAAGAVLLSSMRRINPSIPATRNLGATFSLERFVFILPDSHSHRLDIATTDAKGRYVHLIADGAAQPRLKVAGL